jgi:penicillin-binding protein 1A
LSYFEPAMKNILTRVITPSRVRVCLVVIAGLLLLVIAAGLYTVKQLSRDLPSLARIQNIEPPRKTLILAANGDTIHEFFVENRTVVPLDRMPRRLLEAVVAIEDRRFYQHYGLDMRRFVQIVWINLTSSESPGASTITQQLARNTFLTLDKKISRKIKEMILALQIEQTYSKDEILAMYLNEIYMGSGTYGMQAASRLYFGKNVWELADAEATLLAGVIQLPEVYSPRRHIDRAYRRRTIVLESMINAGNLSRAEARSINETDVVISGPTQETDAPGFAAYFVEEIRKELEDRYGYDGLYNNGLRVTTTLVPEYQRLMEETTETHLLAMEAENEYPFTKAMYDSLAALGETPERLEYLLSSSVLMNTRTGAVLGLVGGRDYEHSKWNLATQAARQPGSIFKPVIYLTALKHGYLPCSILLDTPVLIDTGVSLWRPRNFNNRFMGPMTVRYALSRSKNVVTAKLINDFGVAPVLDTARQLGINSFLPPVQALALGAGEVNLLEMVAAYAAFGNHGVHVDPHIITLVETENGEILEEARIHQREVLDPAQAYLMSDLMQSTFGPGGTAARARWLGFDRTAAGKTGTYNKYTDAWFVGFTPSLAAGVWVGFDEKVNMGRRATGAHMALPIWAGFMKRVVRDFPDEEFVRPAGIVEKHVCLRSGMLATTSCDSTSTEVFLADNFPQRPCDLHGGPLQDFDGIQKDFSTLDDEDEF